MIHEEICTYEVAKLAKEKGFDEYVEAFYAEGCEIAHSQGPEKWNEYNSKYAAPTQSVLQRWLREEKRIHMVVFPNITNTFKFYYIVYNKGDKFWKPIYITHSDFTTYELALEDALKYTLENLVICGKH